MKYLVKSPWLLRKIYNNDVWSIRTDKQEVFLSFDDGPHPEITPLVLDILDRYNAKATFFCIGKNVKQYPEVYAQILQQGHSVGNHTYTHCNGWKTKDEEYLQDIRQAKQYIDSHLFRPPYGRITNFQRNQLVLPAYKLKVIMWSVLSGDFDPGISDEKCVANVTLHAKAGSIIVFHDSEKAAEKMLYALPLVLEYLRDKGYSFSSINL